MIFLTTAFGFGLLGSFHCIGMCGPIAFALPINRSSIFSKTLGITTYHLGRIFTYSILGLIAGLIGDSLGLFGIQQQFSIALGVIIIIAVAFPMVKRTLKIHGYLNTFILNFQNKFRTFLRNKGYKSLFSIGLLNGLLPCGLVYMAMAAAILGNSLAESTFYMTLFGIGTIPLMSLITISGMSVQQKQRKRILKFIPVIMVLFGLIFIFRGLNLGIPFLSPEVNSTLHTIEACH